MFILVFCTELIVGWKGKIGHEYTPRTELVCGVRLHEIIIEKYVYTFQQKFTRLFTCKILGKILNLVLPIQY